MLPDDAHARQLAKDRWLPESTLKGATSDTNPNRAPLDGVCRGAASGLEPLAEGPPRHPAVDLLPTGTAQDVDARPSVKVELTILKIGVRLWPIGATHPLVPIGAMA